MQNGTIGGCGSGSGQCGCSSKVTTEAAKPVDSAATPPRQIAQKYDFSAAIAASPTVASAGHGVQASVNGVALHDREIGPTTTRSGSAPMVNCCDKKR